MHCLAHARDIRDSAQDCKTYIIHADKTVENVLLVTATSGANLEVSIWLYFGWMQSEAIMGEMKDFWQCTFNSRKGRRSSSLASANTQQGQGSGGQRERREWVSCKQSSFSKKFEAKRVSARGSTLRN
jgi:hypothetical protein